MYLIIVALNCFQLASCNPLTLNNIGKTRFGCVSLHSISVNSISVFSVSMNYFLVLKKKYFNYLQWHWIITFKCTLCLLSIRWNYFYLHCSVCVCCLRPLWSPLKTPLGPSPPKHHIERHRFKESHPYFRIALIHLDRLAAKAETHQALVSSRNDFLAKPHLSPSLANKRQTFPHRLCKWRRLMRLSSTILRRPIASAICDAHYAFRWLAVC